MITTEIIEQYLNELTKDQYVIYDPIIGKHKYKSQIIDVCLYDNYSPSIILNKTIMYAFYVNGYLDAKGLLKIILTLDSQYKYNLFS